ncbi:MAG: acyltransferase [Actinobacteria bacterium 13_2_20CM_2_72_6]|nr:MAG: acyltransferase [Actinobacteria bacterium 13_2_20CM_2_72_6]
MLIRHRGQAPVVDPSAFVAPNATLVGDVRIGPRARVLYGAVLDAEGASIDVAADCVISEHAVLRATAVGETPHPVLLGDHVFVGPHATLLGCAVARCCYLASGATVLQGARLGAGAVVAVGALAHAGALLPPEMFVPPMTVAIGDPAEIFTPDKPADLANAIKGVNFAQAAFGVSQDWEDRVARYERIADVRVAEYAAHLDDEIIREL